MVISPFLSAVFRANFNQYSGLVATTNTKYSNFKVTMRLLSKAHVSQNPEYLGFYSQVPETRVLEFCPNSETLLIFQYLNEVDTGWLWTKMYNFYCKFFFLMEKLITLISENVVTRMCSSNIFLVSPPPRAACCCFFPCTRFMQVEVQYKLLQEFFDMKIR